MISIKNKQKQKKRGCLKSQLTFETPLKNVYFEIKREDARLLWSVPVDREPKEAS